MTDNKILSTDVQLEAKADEISAKKEEDPKKTEKGLPFVIPLKKPRKLNDEMIESVDLSGLKNLTTLDIQELDAVMEEMNWHPRNKFRDTRYLKHMAMRVTGYPVEFFNLMDARDINNVTSRETLYFLFG